MSKATKNKNKRMPEPIITDDLQGDPSERFDLLRDLDVDLESKADVLEAFFQRRGGGWVIDESEGWRYSRTFSCTALNLLRYEYEYLVPYAPWIFWHNSAPLRAQAPYDLLLITSVGVTDGIVGCAEHSISRRELQLCDLTEEALDAALSEVEIELSLDDVMGFIRCRLDGPCSYARDLEFR